MHTSSVSPNVNIVDQDPEESKEETVSSNKICGSCKMPTISEIFCFVMIVLNLILSTGILLITSTYLTRSIIVDAQLLPESVMKLINSSSDPNALRNSGSDMVKPSEWMPNHGILSKMYCIEYLTLSLFVEWFAQFQYTGGSVLLFLGAVKSHVGFCYIFVIVGILSILLSGSARFAQLFICDTADMMSRDEQQSSYMPSYFKLIFICLVCQLTWYWFMLGVVVTSLNRMYDGKIKDLQKKMPSPQAVSHNTPDNPNRAENESELQKDTKF